MELFICDVVALSQQECDADNLGHDVDLSK
jgi:hypothetical protein